MDDQNPQFELTEPDFLALLVQHEPALRAYARFVVPDWDLVDESLQEASVTMWQKRGQLESADGFVPWARVILRFKCLRQLEKLRSRRPLLSDEQSLQDEFLLHAEIDTGLRQATQSVATNDVPVRSSRIQTSPHLWKHLNAELITTVFSPRPDSSHVEQPIDERMK